MDFSGHTALTVTEVKDHLNGLYKLDCCHDHADHEFKLSGGIETALAKMVQQIWKDKGMPPTINKAVAKAFFEQLWSGVTEGYGKTDVAIDYETPDGRMLVNLQNNVYQFSAAKNYQQLKALTAALVGDDGKVRSYSQFKKAAFGINDTHVNQWLKVEYNTSIASAQMASKWVDIQENIATLPMLEYDAVMDNNTSDLCRGFDGILRPVNDDFWNQFYPPNHFGCRSSVRQRTGGKPTNLNNLAIPEGIPEMFKVNLGKQGLVFPKGHTYFIGTPQEVLDSLIDDNG